VNTQFSGLGAIQRRGHPLGERKRVTRRSPGRRNSRRTVLPASREYLKKEKIQRRWDKECLDRKERMVERGKSSKARQIRNNQEKQIRQRILHEQGFGET